MLRLGICSKRPVAIFTSRAQRLYAEASASIHLSVERPQWAMPRATTIRAAIAGFALLSLTHLALGHDGKAVDEINGSVSADWTYSDGSYTTLQSYGAAATLNVPLWRFLGGTAFASTYRTRAKSDYSDLGLGGPYAGSRGDSTLGAALFARTPELGRLGFNYREAFQSNQFAYSLELAAYLSRWTLLGGIERAGAKDIRTSQSTTARFADNTYLIGASLYPLDELRLDGRANVFERDIGRIYSGGIEWLPVALGMPISARLSYSRVAGDLTFATSNTYGISVTYFFAPTVSLINLDKAYR